MQVIRLTKAQQIVFARRNKYRFRVLVAGRRFGKTHDAIAELMDAATAKPDQICWYVAPTYRQAQQIAWKKLKLLVPKDWLVKAPNETDLSMELRNGSTIALRGADNADSLRGVGLDFLILDEYADMHPDAWAEVLLPALTDKQGRALFIGTPKGFNHFYDLYQYALHGDENGRDENWMAWQFTTLQGGNVAASELAMAKRNMPLKKYKQEFDARFEAPEGRVYYSFERAFNVREDLYDLGAELYIGMDFNVNPMSAVVGNRAGDQLHWFDEIILPNSNTDEMVEAIKGKFPGRPIIVHPDPSGQARKTSAPLGVTDLTKLTDAGFEVIAPPQAPLVVDRVNTVNAMWCNAAGERRMFVHPRCKTFIKGSEGLCYKSGTKVIDKGAGLDHVTDAAGYTVCAEFPMVEQFVDTIKLTGY